MDQLYLHIFFCTKGPKLKHWDASAVFSFVRFLFPAVLIHLNLFACFGGTLPLLS